MLFLPSEYQSRCSSTRPKASSRASMHDRPSVLLPALARRCRPFALGLVPGRAKKGVLLHGHVRVMIGPLVALGVAAIIAMGVLAVIGGSEYPKFAIAMVP